MARVYQSRALIDPSLYQLSGQLMNERIRQEHDRRKMLVDALSRAGADIGKTINSGIEAYKQRKDELGRDAYLKRVLEQNPEYAQYAENPFFKAGMHEFVRTGSSSPLMAFLGQENTRKIAEAAAEQRKAEATERANIEKAKAVKELAIKQATAKGQIDDLLLKASEAYDEGYDDKGNAYVERAQRLANAYEIADFDPEGFKTSEMAGRDKRKASRLFRAQIEDEIAKGLPKDSDLLVMRQTVANAYNSGQLTKSDYDKLDEELRGSKTVQGQFREGARNTRVNIQNKKIEAKQEEQDAADKALKDLQAGEPIFGKAESVFLKVYGKDPAKMELYHKVND